MKIDITSEDHTSLIFALKFYVADDLRLRRHESARIRLKRYIALLRKLDVANHNSFAMKRLKTFAQLRAFRLELKKKREAKENTSSEALAGRETRLIASAGNAGRTCGEEQPPTRPTITLDDPVILDFPAHDGRGNVFRTTLNDAGFVVGLAYYSDPSAPDTRPQALTA
jgi:hypothetical protein